MLEVLSYRRLASLESIQDYLMEEWELGNYSDKEIWERLVSGNGIPSLHEKVKNYPFYNTVRQTQFYKD